MSPHLFRQFDDAASDLSPQIFLLELEFEYLNNQKIESVSAFLGLVEKFVTSIDRSIPLGIEIRNSNYLTREYFRFLKDHDISHVFSEKIFMPHIYEVYDEKDDITLIASMLKDLTKGSRLAQVYVNNHYEGSAPKTIDKLEVLLHT